METRISLVFHSVSTLVFVCKMAIPTSFGVSWVSDSDSFLEHSLNECSSLPNVLIWMAISGCSNVLLHLMLLCLTSEGACFADYYF